MKRVLVCGGRDYGRLHPKRILEHPKRRQERARLCEVLGKLAVELGTFVMIHGGASGADALADEWAKNSRGFPKPEVFKAAWKDVSRPGAVIKRNATTGEPYDAAAGPVRNQRMIDEGKPDLVIAFPGKEGTEDMISRAEKAEIEVRRIK